MDTIINYIYENFTTIIEKRIENFISDGKSLAEFNLEILSDMNELACFIISNTLDEYNKAIKLNPDRLELFEVVRNADPKSILTLFGQVNYKRDYYKNKETNSYSYLLDSIIGISAHDSISNDVAIKAVEEATYSSYEKAGRSCCLTNDKVSKQSVKRILHELDPKVIYFPYNKPKSKKSIDYLYIEADEDHVALQTGSSTISKLVYVHEGFEINKGVSKRKSLKNVRYFDGMDMSTDKLWESVLDYITDIYDLDNIKRIYISGDGASWIRKGTEWIPDCRYVLDNFHLEKYIKLASAHAPEEFLKLFRHSIRIADFDSFVGYSKLIIDYTRDSGEYEDTKIESVIKAISYIKKNWDGISIKCDENEKIIGCSAEGHVSHIFSNRLSSRPKGWSKHGLCVMSKLLVYKFNGGDIKPLILDFNAEKTKLEEHKSVKRVRKSSKKLLRRYHDRYNYSVPAYSSGRRTGTYKALAGLINLKSII